MYFFYKQGLAKQHLSIPREITIIKRMPKPFVEGMNSMQIGRKRYLYFQFMTFLYLGFNRVFKEYDMVIENKIVSKAVVISKVPIYRFLPIDGIHICYCETIPEARGKGYYPLLLSYIQNDFYKRNCYMIVDKRNTASIKGIEKAGFIRYSEGEKKVDGSFVLSDN